MGFRDQAKPAPAAPTKPAPAAAPPPRGTPTSAPAAGRYSGLRPAEGRSPFLEEGSHGVEFVFTGEIRTKAKDPWLKTELLIRESDNEKVKPGQKRTIRKVITDKAFEMSGPEITSMVVAAMGFDPSTQFEEFAAAHPDWPEMIDAVHGVPAACAKFGDNPLAGMTARVVGYPVKSEDGQMTFINCSWEPWSPAP